MATLPLDGFRDYLSILARAQLGPRLRRKVSVSDIVQDTLLEAHRARERFRGETPNQQAVWLRQILIGQIARAHRHHQFAKRRMDRELSLEGALEQSSLRLERWLAAEQSTPSGKVARAEDVLRMVEALASLPEDQQEALLLHFCDDLSMTEIGDELAVTRHTAGRLVRRGLAELRRRLAPDGQNP